MTKETRTSEHVFFLCAHGFLYKVGSIGQKGGQMSGTEKGGEWQILVGVAVEGPWLVMCCY